MLEPEQKEDIIYYSSMSIFSLATICVVIYILLGTYFIANVALALYAVSFAAICLFSIRKLFVAKYYKEKLNDLNYPENLTEQEKNDYDIRRTKLKKLIKSTTIREVVKIVFSGLFAVFTIVVLILF